MHHLKLATARKRKRLSRYALGKKSGVAKTTISRLERGLTRRPAHDTVNKLEDALEIPRGTLQFQAAL